MTVRPTTPRDLGLPTPDLTRAVALVRPRLRGVIHSVALPVVAIAGTVLIFLAPAGAPRLAATIYTFSSVAIFAGSTVYHLHGWRGRHRRLFRSIDHAGICLGIAGTYTPFGLLALDGRLQVELLAGIWAGALAGAALQIFWSRPPRWMSTSLYVVLGWTAVIALPELTAAAGMTAMGLVVAGGLVYSLGGVVFALHRPNPFPRLFGFHEVFHAMTVAAFVLQYLAVSIVVY
jgi:hemolysin III